MVKKKEMTTAVTKLEKELAGPPKETPPEPVENNERDVSDPTAKASDETVEDFEGHLKQVEHLLEEHGVDVDELKGLWENFVKELKDLPAQKPLVTVFGAFLLGFIAGRSSRK